MAWLRDRALTLALMALFLLFLAGQLITGFAEFNSERVQHGQVAVTAADYLATGHPWEALFENWESEFLQMAAFVLLTTFMVQKGSPESRRPGAKELVDADPRDFAHDPRVPWPVRRGGWILPDLRAFSGPRVRRPLLDHVGGSCAGRICRVCVRPGGASAAATSISRLPDVGPVLVRIISELAKRVSGDRVDGVAGRVPPSEMVAGIKARACTA